MRRLAGVALSLAILQGCGGRSLVASESYSRKPLADETPPYTASARATRGAQPGVVVQVQQAVRCPRPVFAANDEPERVCGQEPAAGVRVRIVAASELGKPVFEGRTDANGLASGPIDASTIVDYADYRIIVQSRDAGSARSLNRLAAQTRPAREVQPAPAPTEQTRNQDEEILALATPGGSGSEVVLCGPPAARSAGPSIPVRPDDIFASRKRVKDRLHECAALPGERATRVFETASEAIESQMRPSGGGLRSVTARRLHERGSDRLREDLEAVAMGGLTEYALGLYFAEIDGMACSALFGVTVDDCDALTAAARGVKLAQPPAGHAPPEDLLNALRDAGMDEASAQLVVAYFDASLRNVLDASQNTIRGRGLAAMVPRCPRQGEAESNLRAWQRGATPELATCVVRESGGGVAVLRDVFFAPPGLNPLPLPVVRQFVEWSRASER